MNQSPLLSVHHMIVTALTALVVSSIVTVAGSSFAFNMEAEKNGMYPAMNTMEPRMPMDSSGQQNFQMNTDGSTHFKPSFQMNGRQGGEGMFQSPMHMQMPMKEPNMQSGQSPQMMHGQRNGKQQVKMMEKQVKQATKQIEKMKKQQAKLEKKMPLTLAKIDKKLEKALAKLEQKLAKTKDADDQQDIAEEIAELKEQAAEIRDTTESHLQDQIDAIGEQIEEMQDHVTDMQSEIDDLETESETEDSSL